MALGGAVDPAQGRRDAGKAIEPLQSSERRQVAAKLPYCLDPLAQVSEAVADGQDLACSFPVELGEAFGEPRIIEIHDLYQTFAIQVTDPLAKLTAQRTGGIREKAQASRPGSGLWLFFHNNRGK